MGKTIELERFSAKLIVFLFVAGLSPSYGASISTNYENAYNPQQGSRPAAYEPPTSVDPLNIFDTELLKYVAKSNPGNFMISPASVKAALALILEGARGSCADELKRNMRLPNDQAQIRKHFREFMASLNTRSDGVLLESANKIFLSHNYKSDSKYAEILRNNYYSEILPVSFPNPDTTNHINKIINASTHGLIPEILSPGSVSPDTIMILTNALYFKGLWENAFYPKLTKSKCFKVDNGCRDVAMMEIHGDYNYGYIDLLQSHAIEIPYKGGKYSMVIVLPNDVNGLQTLLTDISYLSLPEILKKMTETDVELSMPKFSIDFSQDLIHILQQIGIQEVFNSNADLFGLVENRVQSPHINSVFHKTRLEVNEQGSIAAAATGSMVVPLIGTTGIMLNIDHPFLFFIRDVRTGTTLFQGRVTHPDIYRPTPTYQQQPLPATLNRQPSASRIPKPTVSPQPLYAQNTNTRDNDYPKITLQRPQFINNNNRPVEKSNPPERLFYEEGQQVVQYPPNNGIRITPQPAAPVYNNNNNYPQPQTGKQSPQIQSKPQISQSPSFASSNPVSNVQYSAPSNAPSAYVPPSLLQSLSGSSSVPLNIYFSNSPMHDQNNYVREQSVSNNDFGLQRKRQDSVDRTYTMQTIPNRMDKIHTTVLNKEYKDAITFQ